MNANASSTPNEIPTHVPPELVRSSGLTEGAEFLASPHAYMAAMHENFPPVYYNTSPNIGNAWHVTRYEDAYFVLRHPEIFSSHGSVGFPRDPRDWFYFIPLEIDPPDHRKYRNIVDPLFSPKAIAKLENYIRGLANELIDQFIAKRECEFTQDFGRPLPVSVFLDLMGLPQNMRDTFVEWAIGLLHSQSREVAGQSMRSIASYLKSVIAEKTNAPDEGVISTIIRARPDGVPLSEREIFGFVFFLFIGGLDTVFASLNNVFLWLAENPVRRQEIIDHPENLVGATEELLRAFSVTFSGRVLTQDHELRGVQMKKGDKITSVLPAANYDPTVFDNPREINFKRPRKPMLAFAGGVHSCMGAHLARLEMRICISEFLRRIPNFQLKEGFKVEYYAGGVVGPKKLPLTW